MSTVISPAPPTGARRARPPDRGGGPDPRRGGPVRTVRTAARRRRRDLDDGGLHALRRHASAGRRRGRDRGLSSADRPRRRRRALTTTRSPTCGAALRPTATTPARTGTCSASCSGRSASAGFHDEGSDPEVGDRGLRPDRRPPSSARWTPARCARRPAGGGRAVLERAARLRHARAGRASARIVDDPEEQRAVADARRTSCRALAPPAARLASRRGDDRRDRRDAAGIVWPRLVVFSLLALLLRRRLGPVTALALAGLLLDAGRARHPHAAARASGAPASCLPRRAWTPAPWTTAALPPTASGSFSGAQRLLNIAVFVPAGALLVLRWPRWRLGWLLVPARSGAARGLSVGDRAARSSSWPASTGPATSPTSSTTSPGR